MNPVAVHRFEQLPEELRRKLSMSQTQHVYEQFSSNISGFKPTTAEDLVVGYVDWTLLSSH